MSESEPSGAVALARALALPRNARRGFTLGVLATAGVLAFFVLVPETTRPVALYLALAFVLAVSLGALLTVALTALTAVRLSRSE